jgi:hypothetical protein
MVGLRSADWQRATAVTLTPWRYPHLGRPQCYEGSLISMTSMLTVKTSAQISAT